MSFTLWDGLQMAGGFVAIAAYMVGVREIGRDRHLGSRRTVIAIAAMAIPVILIWYALVRLDRTKTARAQVQTATAAPVETVG